MKSTVVSLLTLMIGVGVSWADETKSNYALNIGLGNSSLTLALLKIEKGEKDWTASVVASNENVGELAFKEAKSSEKAVELLMTFRGEEATVEFVPAKEGSTSMVGSFSFGGRSYTASFDPTEETKIDPQKAQKAVDLPKEFTEYMNLKFTTQRLQFQIQRAEDEEAKTKLTDELDEANKKLAAEGESLLKSALEASKGNAIFFTISNELLTMLLAKPENAVAATELASEIEKASSDFGPNWETETLLGLSSSLVKIPELAALALEKAEKASASLVNASTTKRLNAIKIELAAAKIASPKDKALSLSEMVEKFETILDEEYLKAPPLFKPEAFAGRKGESKRVVLMELFTGAQCPPCIASDLAFDVLHDIYPSKDLVLLQYHMHIPGPDPLTNTASEARWEAYTKKYPSDVGGTPTTIFDGVPKAGGGGGKNRAQVKYTEFSEIINELLETPAEANIALTATKENNKINVEVAITDLAKPGPNRLLHIFLVEENIRYVGGNGLRFHHQVVRDLPTGAGIKLESVESKHNLTIDLDEVRKKLSDYITNFEKTGEFPSPDRPMKLEHVQVVAVIQDAEELTVLQSAIVKPTE